MKLLCNDCSHDNICKFKESYLATVDTLRVDIPTPFNLELKCPHFNANLSYTVSPHYLTCTPTLSFDDSCTTLCATGEAKPATVDLSEYEQLTFNDLVK